MAVGEYLGNGNPDGTSLGSAVTEKLSVYGVTPVVQASGAAQGTFTTTLTQSTGWGFLTSTAGDAAVALILAMRTALVNFGIMKGSA